jgi:hypothetical protein
VKVGEDLHPGHLEKIVPDASAANQSQADRWHPVPATSWCALSGREASRAPRARADEDVRRQSVRHGHFNRPHLAFVHPKHARSLRFLGFQQTFEFGQHHEILFPACGSLCLDQAFEIQDPYLPAKRLRHDRSRQKLLERPESGDLG